MPDLTLPNERWCSVACRERSDEIHVQQCTVLEREVDQEHDAPRDRPILHGRLPGLRERDTHLLVLRMRVRVREQLRQLALENMLEAGATSRSVEHPRPDRDRKPADLLALAHERPRQDGQRHGALPAVAVGHVPSTEVEPSSERRVGEGKPIWRRRWLDARRGKFASALCRTTKQSEAVAVTRESGASGRTAIVTGKVATSTAATAVPRTVGHVVVVNPR